MKKINILSIALVSFLLTACGGESDSSNSEIDSAEQTYDLTEIWIKNDYQLYSTEVLASNESDKYKYEAIIRKQSDTIINGIDTKQYLSTWSYTNSSTDSVTNTGTSTSYYNSDGIKIQTVSDNGVICTLENTPTLFSSKTKIGDSGVGSNMTCTDGMRSTEVWTLRKIGNSAVLEEVSNSYDSGDNLYTIGTIKHTVDTSGKVISMAATVEHVQDGYTDTYLEADLILE